VKLPYINEHDHSLSLFYIPNKNQDDIFLFPKVLFSDNFLLLSSKPFFVICLSK